VTPGFTAAGVVAGSAASTSRCGSTRSSQRGRYQLARPRSAIVAGTSTRRTTVASMRTATAIPTPIIFTVTFGSSAKPTNTAIMIAAALVMTRPVAARPRTTLPCGSPVASQSSRIRESRNTS
jgi:hypothetical protein